MRYKNKPKVIEALQWDGTIDNIRHIQQIFPDMTLATDKRIGCDEIVLEIKTLEGWYQVCPTDFIIRGIVGEYYPCREDIFHKTYFPENTRNNDQPLIADNFKERDLWEQTVNLLEKLASLATTSVHHFDIAREHREIVKEIESLRKNLQQTFI